MYSDLYINYENPGNMTKEKYSDYCEILTSAICDNYQILAVNTKRKGVVNAIDINSYKDADLKLIFQTYSLKFLNSSNINQSFIDWDKIKILSRLTIDINDAKEIFQFSNPNVALKSYDILSVQPKNEKMFEMCLNDLNVDLISLNLEEKFNFSIKKHLILSAIDKNVFFEIVYSDFIKDTTKRSVFIANVLQLLEVTKGKSVIISSGADNYFDHRSPYDVITMFETIFDFKTDKVMKMISDNCEKIILKSIQRKYFKTVIEVNVEDNLNFNNKMIVDGNI